MEMKQLNLNSLRTSESIWIHTANSVYQFSVTDPVNCTGVLRGGPLKDEALPATLLCGLPHEKEDSDWLSLTPGAKAVFFCACATGIRRLITTRIKKIARIGSDLVEENVSMA